MATRGEQGGGKVEVDERRLGKEEGRKCQQQRAPGGYLARGQRARQSVKRGHRDRGKQRHRRACHPRRKPQQAPREGEVNHDQRRVAFRQGRLRYQQPRVVKVQRRGDVVSGFVPKVWQPQ